MHIQVHVIVKLDLPLFSLIVKSWIAVVMDFNHFPDTIYSANWTVLDFDSALCINQI